jgi:hypothetical protein
LFFFAASRWFLASFILQLISSALRDGNDMGSDFHKGVGCRDSLAAQFACALKSAASRWYPVS